jgi:rubrerythrin
MMRFENARVALQHAKTFHQQLGDFYHSLSPQVTQPKAKLLLDYIIHQERSLVDALSAFKSSSPKGVLDTWLQYTNDSEILQLPDIAVSKEIHSDEDILNISTQMSDELLSLYAQVEEQIDEEKVKAIFHNLADMQVQKQKKITMNYDRMMDM